MTTNAQYSCDHCGGAKRLFLERGPVQLALSVSLFTLILLFQGAVPAGWLRLAFVYVMGAVALLPALSLIRIRCLKCEPEWKDKLWGH
jgi:hypothetical protein